MTNITGLVLTRKDLKKGRVEAKDVRFISLDDFDAPSFKAVHQADIVMFVDDDNRTRILKNAYGSAGNVMKSV